MTSSVIGLILAMLAVEPALAQVTSAKISTPEALFQSACTGDQVALPSDRFHRIGFADLPLGAKSALTFAATDFKVSAQGAVPENHPAPLNTDDVPNALFEMLPKKDILLLMAAPDGSSGRAANLCAVLWRGNDYHKAVAAGKLALLTDKPWTPVIGEYSPVGSRYTRLEYRRAIVVASEIDGWTALTLAPDSIAPVEQPKK